MLPRFLPLLLLGAASVTGCFTHESIAEPLPPPSPLRMELEDFAGYFATRVEQAADQILQQSQSASVSRNTLYWRMRAIPACRRTLVLADDRAVLLEQWLISARMLHYFESDEGKATFGEFNDLALATSKDIEARVRGTAARLLTKKEFTTARENVMTFAKTYPELDRFDILPGKGESWAAALSATLDKPFSVLEMPFSHVNPTNGLSDAAAAAHRVAATVEQLTTAVKYVPDDTRWQTDLLVLELEESESVKTGLQALRDVGEGTARIAKTAENLPATLTADLSKLIDDIDQKQATLQTTLDKAHATAREAHATVESVDATLGQLDTVVKATDPSAQSLTRMGESLSVTFEKFTKLLEVLFAPSPTPTPPAEQGPPFDINDYGRTADKITETAKELSVVLDRLEELTRSDKVTSLAGTANATMRSVLDYLFVGVGILVLFGFLVALGYRFLARSM